MVGFWVLSDCRESACEKDRLHLQYFLEKYLVIKKKGGVTEKTSSAESSTHTQYHHELFCTCSMDKLASMKTIYLPTSTKV